MLLKENMFSCCKQVTTTVVGLMLCMASVRGRADNRAQVGFHLHDESLVSTIHPFTVLRASDSSSQLSLSAFTPPSIYKIDSATTDAASPGDITAADPILQAHSLVCPDETDEVTPQARSYDRRAWESIQKKYPLHLQSKWRYFSLQEWVYFVQCMTAHISDAFKPGSLVFDSGSGAGAFLKALVAIHPGLEVYGTDLSPVQIQFANSHVYKRSFCVADSINIGWVADQFPEGFDVVISNGVMYMAVNTTEGAFHFVKLMVDIAKPGGLIWLGTNNDGDKRKDPSNEYCFQWDGGSGDLFLEKKWWVDNLDKWGTEDLQIVDENDACAALYVGDRCRYSIVMRKRTNGYSKAAVISLVDCDKNGNVLNQQKQPILRQQKANIIISNSTADNKGLNVLYWFLLLQMVALFTYLLSRTTFCSLARISRKLKK